MDLELSSTFVACFVRLLVACSGLLWVSLVIGAQTVNSSLIVLLHSVQTKAAAVVVADSLQRTAETSRTQVPEIAGLLHLAVDLQAVLSTSDHLKNLAKRESSPPARH